MTDEQRLFLSKIEDMAVSVQKGRYCAFSRFQSMEEQFVSERVAAKYNLNVKKFGGYDDAERAIVTYFNGDEPDSSTFPLVAIRFLCQRFDDLSHRDVLGALMSLGIKRETIGDIIFTDGFCVIFVYESMAEFIVQNLVSVRKYKISPEIYYGEIVYERQYEALFCTVTSMRLDCIVSELASMSRSSASECIEAGFVNLNGCQCMKKDKTVDTGDILSVRKKGKFKINEIVGKTKKDRYKLSILKYN